MFATPRAAADLLEIPIKRVRDLIDSGRLKTERIGDRPRVPVDRLIELLAPPRLGDWPPERSALPDGVHRIGDVIEELARSRPWLRGFGLNAGDDLRTAEERS
jgi:hypothetical protein